MKAHFAYRCDVLLIKHCATKERVLGQHLEDIKQQALAGTSRHAAGLHHALCLTKLHKLLAGTEQDRQYEHIIQQALSGVIQAAMHPRTAISIILQV